MGLYLDNGFVNIRYCVNFGCPYTIIIGGRGTGKTFGAQKYCLEEHRVFMLMRRTQAQADLIAKPQFSPINPVMEYLHMIPQISVATRYNGVITYKITEDGDPVMAGYTAALSTFSNLRGFDGSRIQTLIYDEFIPERHEHPIKAEADAFFNVYETINRNRELAGDPPLQVLLLSNSNSMISPILAALGLSRKLEKMQTIGQSEYINRDRGIAVFLLYDSPISSKKAQTALYRATAGTEFSKMALDNRFAYDDLDDVKSLPIKSGWKLFARFGKIFFYEMGGKWYLSEHGAGKPSREFEWTDIGIKQFIRKYPRSYQRIIEHKIIYETFEIKFLFTNLFI